MNRVNHYDKYLILSDPKMILVRAMSNPLPTSSSKRAALALMRRGLLIMIASSVVIATILFITLVGVAYSIMGASLSSYGEVLPVLPWEVILVAALIALLATGAIYLYGALGKFIPGISRLARVDSSYSTPSMLVKMGFLGGLISVALGVSLMIAGILSTPIEAFREIYTSPPSSEEAVIHFLQKLHPSFLAGAVFVIFGLIFILLYQIGLVVLLMKLKEKERISSYGTAGYLLLVRIVSYFIPFSWAIALGGIIGLVALLIFYSALGDTIQKMSEEVQPETPQLPRYPDDTSITL